MFALIRILLLIVLFQPFKGFNQNGKEYFVTIDTLTGKYTKVAFIPGVRWINIAPNYTCFDQKKQIYYFRGIDSLNTYRLYSLRASDGLVLNNPVFPQLNDPNDNVIELQIDNSTGKMYALHWDNSIGTEFLVNVDPSNGSFTIIDSIPKVKWIYTATYTVFDEKNHLYIFIGADANFVSRLYSVDVVSGKVISNPLFPNLSDPSDNISDLKFNNSNHTLYGLHWDNSQNKEFLISLDSGTANIRIIDSIQDVKWLQLIPNYSVLDENRNRYMFRASGSDMKFYEYTIDLSNAKIVRKFEFPVFCNPWDNLIEWHHDKVSDKLYALHWEEKWLKLRDTTVCPKNSVRFNVPANARWSNGDSGTTILPKYPGNYSYTSKNLCDSGVMTDTVYIGFRSINTSLPEDTFVCQGAMALITETSNFRYYKWSNGSRFNSALIDDTGTFYLTIRDPQGCFFTDSVKLHYLSINKPDLGPDAVICSNFPVTLGNKSYYRFLKYDWNNGSVAETIKAHLKGYYTLKTTDSNSCLSSDTVFVDNGAYIAPPDIGKNKLLCRGDSLSLACTGTYFKYYWNTNDTSKVIFVKDTGLFTLTVTDTFNCQAKSSLYVGFHPFQGLELGPDVKFCNNKWAYLSVKSPYTYDSYLWNTGDKMYYVNVSNEGKYFLRVKDNNGCSYTDSVRAIKHPVHIADLGPDSILCRGDSVLIHDRSAYKYTSYFWNTGARTKTIKGIAGVWYNLKVVDANNCESIDWIRYSTHFFPEFDLGNDTVICEGENLNLAVSVPGSDYIWNDGNSDSVRSINKSGKYSLTISRFGCDTVDAINLEVWPYPQPELGSMTFCDNPIFILDAGEAKTYLWNTGESSRRIIGQGNNKYWVKASNGRCSNSDTLEINYIQNHPFYMPDAFSPNGDGHNDNYTTQTDFEVNHVLIYNRWGGLVYRIDDAIPNWDGRFNGVTCQEGVYLIIVKYRDCAGKMRIDQKMIQLLN